MEHRNIIKLQKGGRSLYALKEILMLSGEKKMHIWWVSDDLLFDVNSYLIKVHREMFDDGYWYAWITGKEIRIFFFFKYITSEFYL